MAREDLIPFNQRTEDEQKKIASKGGVTSGVSRRRKRTIKQLARQFLDADISREDLRAVLEEYGFSDDLNYAAALVITIAKEAFTGNVRAAELLVKLAGSDPEQKRKDAELQLKRAELKLKQDLIRQQTIKLRKFNFGDDEDTSWVLHYDPENNPVLKVLRWTAEIELEDFVSKGGSLDAIDEKFGHWLEEYVRERHADLMIQKQKKTMIQDRQFYEAAENTDIEEFTGE